ncbi:hypothetical protein ACTVM8_21205, partial [Serratia marcescens]
PSHEQVAVRLKLKICALNGTVRGALPIFPRLFSLFARPFFCTFRNRFPSRALSLPPLKWYR